MEIEYSYLDFKKWYEGVYIDQKPCVKSARPFAILHKQKSKECWLLIHGYRGYPGELIRPAEDLFKAGFDVYCPRLPGNGTSGQDFINSRAIDWLKCAQNALDDLTGQYEKVNLFGHSMGTAIIAILGYKNDKVGKMVYCAPSFDVTSLNLINRIYLFLNIPFRKKIPAPWKSDPRYRQHYEGAPCDSPYLGKEYWSYNFPVQLLEYWHLIKKGLRYFGKYSHSHLVINPLLDRSISKPSLELMKKCQKDLNYVDIENGTHCVIYDKDEMAEQKAIEAIMAYALKEE